MPMSDERSQLIEAHEELEAARKLRKRLLFIKEWAGNIFAGIVLLVMAACVLMILIAPWVQGWGWFSIILVVVGGSLGGWHYLKNKADRKIAEAEKVKQRAMWD